MGRKTQEIGRSLSASYTGEAIIQPGATSSLELTKFKINGRLLGFSIEFVPALEKGKDVKVMFETALRPSSKFTKIHITNLADHKIRAEVWEITKPFEENA